MMVAEGMKIRTVKGGTTMAVKPLLKRPRSRVA
jgi:hypothetical protein